MKTPNLYRMAGAFTVAVACVFAGAVHAQEPTYTQAQQRRRSPVVDVFEAVKPSVVNISTTQIISVRSPMGLEGFFDDFFDMPRRNRVREYRSTSVGSGFVLHPAGYIVTNAHVVARTAERKVIFADGRVFDAQVVAMD